MKTSMKLIVGTAGLALALGLLPLQAAALTITHFNVSTQDFGVGPFDFGKVTVDYLGGNTAHVVVDLNNDFLGAGAKVQKFGFNSSMQLHAGNFSGLPGGWVPYFDRTWGAFGVFNNDPWGGPMVDPLEFDVTVAGLVDENQLRVPNAEGATYVAIIGGLQFPTRGRIITTAKVAAVPEPAMLLVLGAGLLGVGLLRKRKAL